MTQATTSIFADGLGYPEGPVLLADGSLIVTEMARARGCVTRIGANGTSRQLIAKTGRPNGLALDSKGTLWVAESLSPSILQLTLDGEHELWTDSCGDEHLLWPNDLCFGPDGALYLTDSGVLIADFMDGDVPKAGFEKLTLDGRLCRFDRTTRQGSILDRGLQFANGIAFGPGGLLYISETMTGNIYRYSLESDQPERELFGNVLDPEWTGGSFRGPDGMAFDASGHLYVTVFGQGDVTVLDPKGSVTRRIPLRGSAPTNVAFGAEGSQQILVVDDEHGRIETAHVGVDGLALWG